MYVYVYVREMQRVKANRICKVPGANDVLQTGKSNMQSAIVCRSVRGVSRDGWQEMTPFNNACEAKYD